MSTASLDHALALAARGFAVFPCHTMTAAGCSCGHNPTSTPGLCSCGRTELYGAPHGPCDSPGKHPATKDGFKSASRDEAQIRALWAAAPPDANIGIATGAASGGLQVVDADGPEGLASVAGFPPTLSARTGSGGLHLYYRLADGQQRNTTKRIAPGVDSRGDGGYVVAPPSRHASGGVYAWLDENIPIAELPADILAAMRRRGPRTSMGTGAPVAPPAAAAAAPSPALGITEQQRRRRYALAALDGACDDLRRTPNGEKHHAAVSKARKIGGFVGSGLLTAAEAERALFSATVAAGWAKEREHNTLTAIRDGLRYGIDAPLEPPAPTRRTPAPAGGSDEEREAIRSEPRDPAVDALLAQVADLPVLSLKRDKNGAPKNTYANTVAVVRHIYGGAPTNPERRLSFNEMTLTPLVDGEPQREGHDLSALRERIELDHGFAPSAENVKAAVIHVAHEQSFHPVRAFLSALPPWDGVPRVEELARDVLHLDPAAQPLALVFLQKWLISAVARAFDPGCQVDTALVLYGEQGLKKTRFYRVIAGTKFFANTKMTDLSNKEALLQLHSAWIYEWGEIDAITSQRHAGEVKGFITVEVDTFRAPYAAAVARHPRSGVIVGSTNKEKFLSDPTGSRRFWIIDLDHLDPMKGDQLDLDHLEAMRDQLWAEAVHRYRTGEPWWLTPEQDAEREAAAERHAVEDHPWREFVERWLAKKTLKGPLRPLDLPQDQVHISDIFDAMDLKPAMRKHADALTMGNVLRSLGFKRAKPRVHYGSRETVWMWLQSE